ncbi:MAG: penicillin-binding protein activator [Gammaproteobacteria bacterium]|nr:penicillin-binding protein activator [Gammaproteobacteria bacterium]MDH5303460.1 penicillin-binding protein activator [Gammaproteobacteria bacterium]
MLASLAIGACATTGGGISSGPGEGRAERLAQNGQHRDAAAAYAELASATSGPARERLTLLAVEQWLDAGDASRARAAFVGVTAPGDTQLRQLWNTNSATLLLYRGDADGALQVLEAMSREPLPRNRRLRVDALRADAWIQKQDPARAIEIMTRRESLLSSRQDIEENRWHLWQALLLSDPRDLRAAAELTLDENTRGWLMLGSLATSTGQQGIAWINGAVRWRESHANHAAMAVIARLELPDAVILDYPKQIALLLPLSGDAARAGHAVQNGFLGAYFSMLEGLDEYQTIRVYDVDTEGGASAAYMTAVADGAEFVVGPLLRNSVISLANDTLVPVPVLTLNYLPDDMLAPPGLYQFALAPEDEARSAAERAIADGHSRSVALVPNNDWGRRVLSSFTTEFEALGGTMLDYRSYTPANQDFSNTIEDLMGLSGSIQRYQRIRANIGSPLQFDPRRRQDADFVFLGADAPAGRLLKSQLKFHYSGDLPVYATSSIYAEDGRSNSDLNGIMFADTPWIISPQVWIEHLPPVFERNFPDESRLGRLHAMGYDAYQLIAALYTARIGAMPELDGATGKLYLDPDGRVRRRMAWARFQGGEPVPVPDVEYPAGPIRDISDAAEMQPPAADDELWYEQRPE